MIDRPEPSHKTPLGRDRPGQGPIHLPVHGFFSSRFYPSCLNEKMRWRIEEFARFTDSSRTCLSSLLTSVLPSPARKHSFGNRPKSILGQTPSGNPNGCVFIMRITGVAPLFARLAFLLAQWCPRKPTSRGCTIMHPRAQLQKQLYGLVHRCCQPAVGGVEKVFYLKTVLVVPLRFVYQRLGEDTTGKSDSVRSFVARAVFRGKGGEDLFFKISNFSKSETH